MWDNSEKKAIRDPESRLSPDMGFAGALVLDFSASRTVEEKKKMLFINCPGYGISVVATLMD